MQVIVRNLEEKVVKTIDTKAKKIGVSREEYLRKIITYEADSFGMKQERKEHEQVLSKVREAFEYNQERMDHNEELFTKMYLLTAINQNLSLNELDKILMEKYEGI